MSVYAIKDSLIEAIQLEKNTESVRDAIIFTNGIQAINDELSLNILIKCALCVENGLIIKNCDGEYKKASFGDYIVKDNNNNFYEENEYLPTRGQSSGCAAPAFSLRRPGPPKILPSAGGGRRFGP